MPTTPKPPPGIKVEGITDTDTPVGRPRTSSRARRPDPSPKVDAPKPVAGTENEMTPGKVQQAFAEILSLPALAYSAPGTPWQCDFCAKHFASKGPVTAKQLVENRDHYPALYAGMEKIAAAWMAFSLMPIVIEYVGTPVIHHGPDVLQPLAPVFHVPKRTAPVVPGNTHAHTAATAGTARSDNSGQPPASTGTTAP